MSTVIKVKSLIFDDLTYSVPSTIEEYNALDPKRDNPVLEDAIDNCMKHKVLGKFRSDLLDTLETQFQIERINEGTDKHPKWETDGNFMARLAAEVLKTRGKDPSDAASQSEFASELRATAQKVLNAVTFNVAAREATGGTPALAKTYLAWAEQAVAADGGAKLAGLLGKVLNVVITLTGDKSDVETLARAIASNEKRKRDIQLAKAKTEYGVED